MDATSIKHGLEYVKSISIDNQYMLESKDAYFIESFNVQTILDDKKYVSFIKKIEKLVRTSIEYKDYIGHLRTIEGLNHCTIFKNLDVNEGITLEMHHAPFTLYDIVEITANHLLAHKIPTTSLHIADLVMQAHYDHKIGLCPLTETAHKMVHNGSLLITKDMIFGNWLEFMIQFKDGLSDNNMSKILEFITTSDDAVKATYEKLKVDRSQLTLSTEDLAAIKYNIT